MIKLLCIDNSNKIHNDALINSVSLSDDSSLEMKKPGYFHKLTLGNKTSDSAEHCNPVLASSYMSGTFVKYIILIDLISIIENHLFVNR